jgi:MarR family transcriptional regulator for hemolysin
MPNDLPMMSELPLWLQLNKVSKKYMDALASRLSHLGIRRHYFLLVAIGEGKGNLTQQQLADLLEVDKVAMVGILDALTKHGFVRRTPSRTDRRKHLIVLTPKAEKALPEIKRAIRNLNQRALSGLPGALSSHFSAALLEIKAELEKVIRELESSESAPARPRRATARRKLAR